MLTRTFHRKTPRVFLPFREPARYKGSFGGRGSGKSHDRAEAAVEWNYTKPGSRGVCLREVQKTLTESAKLLIEDKIGALGVSSDFRILHDRIETPGRGVIIFRGMTDYTAESIKSLEGFDWAWFEEAQTATKRSLELLRPTIREDGSELWFTWNPRHNTDPVDEFFRGGSAPPDSVIIESSYASNPFFPDVLEQERAWDEEHNPSRYAHIWDGEYEPQAVGAIWDMETINRHRRAMEDLPDLKRVVVSVDPPGSSEDEASEAGITVEALGEDDRGYVLDDVSFVAGPQEWAQRALAVYDLYHADAIVAETNFGGDMVVNTIHAIRPNVRVIKVTASRGKHIRAEPISALYSLGRISHAGAFPQLEAQMCLVTSDGYQGNGSPDRMDSMVWGFTELFPKMIRKTRDKNSPPPTRANNLYNPHRPRARA